MCQRHSFRPAASSFLCLCNRVICADGSQVGAEAHGGRECLSAACSLRGGCEGAVTQQSTSSIAGQLKCVCVQAYPYSCVPNDRRLSENRRIDRIGRSKRPASSKCA